MSDKYIPMFAVGDHVVRSTNKEGMIRIRGFVTAITSYHELVLNGSISDTLKHADEVNLENHGMADWKERPMYVISPDSMYNIYPEGNEVQICPVASYEEAGVIVPGITEDQYRTLVGIVPRIFLCPESCLVEIPEDAPQHDGGS